MQAPTQVHAVVEHTADSQAVVAAVVPAPTQVNAVAEFAESFQAAVVVSPSVACS